MKEAIKQFIEMMEDPRCEWINSGVDGLRVIRDSHEYEALKALIEPSLPPIGSKINIRDANGLLEDTYTVTAHYPKQEKPEAKKQTLYEIAEKYHIGHHALPKELIFLKILSEYLEGNK